MKSSRMKFAAWLVATVACSAAAFSAAQLPPVSPGEKILNTACTACHELRPIETSALDSEGWTKVVASMVDKGAAVKKEEEPLLVKYLVANFGPLPDGPGKAILLEVCTQCHRLDRVKLRGGTRQDWDDLLSHMLNEGAPLSDDDYPILLNYLARNFRQ
jgi:cytochrome c5